MKFDDPDPEQEMSAHVKNAQLKQTIAVDAVLARRKLVLTLLIQDFLKRPPQGEGTLGIGKAGVPVFFVHFAEQL